jgi:hypothetical protein
LDLCRRKMSESSRFEDFQDGCMLTLKVNINNTLMVRTHSHGCIKNTGTKFYIHFLDPVCNVFIFRSQEKLNMSYI